MLPKRRRIQRKEFKELLKAGRRYSSPHLSLFLVKNLVNKPDLESRFAFSVSKKVAKTAVERNKWRRRGYSAIKNVLGGIKNGYLCLFSIKNITNFKFKDLEDEIFKLLSDSGMII